MALAGLVLQMFDSVIVGLCTLAGVGMAFFVTRVGLEMIIHIIPARRTPNPNNTPDMGGAN